MEFKKKNYGGIWIIDGATLKEETMDCEGLSNTVSGSPATVRFSIMTIVAVIMASLYLLF